MSQQIAEVPSTKTHQTKPFITKEATRLSKFIDSQKPFTYCLPLPVPALHRRSVITSPTHPATCLCSKNTPSSSHNQFISTFHIFGQTSASIASSNEMLQPAHSQLIPPTPAAAMETVVASVLAEGLADGTPIRQACQELLGGCRRNPGIIQGLEQEGRGQAI